MTGSERPDEQAEALMERALALDREGRHDEELLVYDELIERFAGRPDPPVRVHVCRAFRAKAITLFDFDRDEEALAVGDELLSRFAGDSDPEIADWVAWTMSNKAEALLEMGRVDEAITVVDDLVRRFDSSDGLDSEPVTDAMFEKATALRDLGRTRDALAAYAEVVERFDSTTDPGLRKALQRTHIAMAALLGDLGEHDQALKVLDELLAGLEGAKPSVIADALMQKGWTLEGLGRPVEAIAAYDEVVTRFADRDKFARRLSYSLAHKAAILARLERADDAVRTYRQLVDAHAATDDPDVRRRVADGLYWTARLQDSGGSMPEALLTHDELVERYGDDTDTGVAEVVARALLDKTRMLSSAGSHEAALETLDEIIRRFDGFPLVSALVRKGVELMTLGRPDEALDVFDDMLTRFGESNDPAISERVAEGLLDKSAALLLLERRDEAVVVIDALTARCEADPRPALLTHMAGAWQNKAVVQVMEERWEDALETFDTLVARFADRDEPDLREMVAMALSYRAQILTQLDRTDEGIDAFGEMADKIGPEAIAAFEAIAARSAHGEGPEQRVQHFTARFNRAIIVAAARSEEEGVADLDELIEEFEADDDPRICELVLMARAKRDEILHED